jgi:hypothetical protein
MSVITCYQTPEGLQNFDVYAKGAPETIRLLSDPRTGNVLSTYCTHLSFSNTVSLVLISQ